MKFEIEITLRNASTDEFIHKSLVQLLKYGERNMAQLDDVKKALADVRTAAAAEKVEVAAKLQKLLDEVQALKDQIAAGNPVTPADLDGLVSELTAAKSDVEGITVPDPVA